MLVYGGTMQNKPNHGSPSHGCFLLRQSALLWLRQWLRQSTTSAHGVSPRRHVASEGSLRSNTLSPRQYHIKPVTIIKTVPNILLE
jgi:hypothetical protein